MLTQQAMWTELLTLRASGIPDIVIFPGFHHFNLSSFPLSVGRNVAKQFSGLFGHAAFVLQQIYFLIKCE